jgi:hypothetical protein
MARSTMATLIAELRGFADVGSDDYTSGGIQWWTDNQLQTVLDSHRTDIHREQLAINPEYVGGSLQYKEYVSQYRNFEQTSGGTAIFVLEDSAGNDRSSSAYSVDYLRGVATFSADTGGTLYYLTGRSYDLNASAAEVWRKKAGYFSASGFDFSTDNMSVKRSQKTQHALEMAKYYEGMAQPTQVSFDRGDLVPGGWS